MKKTVLLFKFLLGFTLSFATTTIEGTIKNIPANKIYLTNRGFGSGPSFVRQVFDSCTTNSDGYFFFSIKQLDESRIYSIEFVSIEFGWIALLLHNNEHVIVNAEIDKRRKIKSVEGCSEYLLMKQLNVKTSTYIDNLNNYADSSSFYYETNPDSSMYYTKLNKLYSDSIKIFTFDFIQEHPKSTYSLHLLKQYMFSLRRDSLKKYLSAFDISIKNTELFKQLQEFANVVVKLKSDEYVPVINVINEKGKKKKLDLERTGAKLVVIDFWASWCVPCRENIPKLKQLYSGLSAESIRIIGISIDEDVLRWQNAVKAEKTPWENYVIPKQESNKIKSLFQIEFIPKYVLVNREGKVILITSDIDEFEKKVTAIM